MENLLLHICCASCATAVIEKLRNENYKVSGLFYNPNIYPLEEYHKRLDSLENLATKIDLPLIIGLYDTKKWEKQTQGLENETENGERCKICYRMRFEYTVKIAKSKGYEVFTTTLTISPHKSASRINYIGQEIGERYGIKFLSLDFKKQNGFKRSIVLSKEYKLYRQSYCGCKYSL